MRQMPKRRGITRLSEDESSRETVRTLAPDQKSESGKFCAACNKWFPHLKQAKTVCNPCSHRLKGLFGTDSES